MKYTLFLCDKCAGEIQLAYIAEEIEETFAHDKCEKCHKMRFGCKYEVRK